MGHSQFMQNWMENSTYSEEQWRHATFKVILETLEALDWLFITLNPVMEHLSSAPVQKYTSEAHQLWVTNISPSCLSLYRGCTSGSDLPQKIMPRFIEHCLQANAHRIINPQPQWQEITWKRASDFLNKSEINYRELRRNNFSKPNFF